jgi:hypothetical protein
VFLGVGGKRVESWWPEGWSVDGSGWMALLLLWPSPFLYTPFFLFWGGDADGGRGVFLSSLSSQSTWGVPLFSPFFAFFTFLLACFSSWSLPSLMIQTSLN